MSFTNEQVAQLLGEIKQASGKRLTSKLEKALSKKGAKFNFDNLMSTLSYANADRAVVKKPANAWQLFLRQFRAGDQVEPGMTGSEIVSKASPVWKGMSAEAKKPFEEEAAQLSLGYRQAKNATKPAKGKSGPTRPKNSWMLFLTQYRAENKQPGVAGSAVVAAAGEVWKGMNAEEKAPFEEKANAAMEEYKSLKKGGDKVNEAPAVENALEKNEAPVIEDGDTDSDEDTDVESDSDEE